MMELADCSLNDRLKAAQAKGQSGLPVEELRRIMFDTADALDFLNHERHILHRDVKPANMLLMANRLKLCDFGLRMSETLALDAGKTMGAGTPVFIAPEVVEGRQSPHSDQYSLAATYYMLRAGRPLFTGAAAEIRMRHVVMIPTFDEGILSEGEKKALLKALSKNPNDRYPTSTAFATELGEAIDGLVSAPGFIGGRRKRRPPGGSRRRALRPTRIAPARRRRARSSRCPIPMLLSDRRGAHADRRRRYRHSGKGRATGGERERAGAALAAAG